MALQARKVSGAFEKWAQEINAITSVIYIFFTEYQKSEVSLFMSEYQDTFKGYDNALKTLTFHLIAGSQTVGDLEHLYYL